MTTSANYPGTPHPPTAPSLDELFGDVPPIRTVEDLACDGIFDTDAELDEFLAYTYAARRADLA